MEKAYFDKENKPFFGQINRNCAYNQVSEDLDRFMPFLKMKKFMLQMAKAANYQGMGLDYVVSERNHTISIIDFNSYPSYKICKYPQIKNMNERYLNELLLKKKKKHFKEYAFGREYFTAGQKFSVSKSAITIQHGFINRSFTVTSISQRVFTGVYKIVAKGGGNLAVKERVKGFSQEFYHRVIELKNTSCVSDENIANVFMVTDYTHDKLQDEELKSRCIVLDSEAFFHLFDFVSVDYTVTISIQ